ncbi:transporter substrate-binding domain-containing protein [Rhodobium gokarnense]|uniref:Polar amino acid transport system substrate-binding protein n=1 Tax=Rhodobium gokarnense TaxID=364296 RepID=A0ABT3HGI5_9HYPH|nr:transporter substrate-binding domain-containing protein [Rhodobium gokarnense]MCW2309504.1 polar amino acid transport system substrate-binding protein [Rhodobium gokarnense]
MRLLSAALAAIVVLAASLPATAKDWKTLRIGIEGAHPPFNYFDALGELRGFDVDVARVICAKLKAECTFVVRDWPDIIDGLTAGAFDTIISSLAITEERRKRIAFSKRYYRTASVFVLAKASAITVFSRTALDHRIIGAQEGTIHRSFLEETYWSTTVRPYPTEEEAFLDLAAGRIDAVFVDKLAATYWLAKHDDGRCCKIAGPEMTISQGIGVGLRKEDEDLKKKIDGAIDAMRADGIYEIINAKYFPFSIY